MTCPLGPEVRRLIAVFNVTGGEVLIILVVALIVLGPEKLPDMIRKAGRLYGELRKMSNGFQSELREAFEEPARELRETANLARNAVTGAMTDLTTSVNEMVRPDLSSTNTDSGPQFDSAAPASSASGAPGPAPVAVVAESVVNPDLAAAIAAEAAEASGNSAAITAAPVPLVGAANGAVATNGASALAAPPATMAPPSGALLANPVAVAPQSPVDVNGVNGVNGHEVLAPPAQPMRFAPPRPLPSPATNGATPPATNGATPSADDASERQPVGLQPPMAPPGGQ